MVSFLGFLFASYISDFGRSKQPRKDKRHSHKKSPNQSLLSLVKRRKVQIEKNLNNCSASARHHRKNVAPPPLKSAKA